MSVNPTVAFILTSAIFVRLLSSVLKFLCVPLSPVAHQVWEEMVNACWCGLLAALSLLLDARYHSTLYLLSPRTGGDGTSTIGSPL